MDTTSVSQVSQDDLQTLLPDPKSPEKVKNNDDKLLATTVGIGGLDNSVEIIEDIIETFELSSDCDDIDHDDAYSKAEHQRFDRVSHTTETNESDLKVTDVNNGRLVDTEPVAIEPVDTNDIQDKMTVNNDTIDVNRGPLDDSNIRDPTNLTDLDNDHDKNGQKDIERREINETSFEVNSVRNTSDKNTEINKIGPKEAAQDATKSISVEMNEATTSSGTQSQPNPTVLFAAKRKNIDSNTTDLETAPKKIKLAKVQDPTKNLSKLRNLKVPVPRQAFAHDDYGFNPDFLKNLGLELPLSSKIGIVGLHNKAKTCNLREVFSLAGEVRNIKYGPNHVEIEFDHPVEAVQAISMFHRRKLHGNLMYVSMEYSVTFLPSGLTSIGRGFGDNGNPLKHVTTILKQRDLNESLSERGGLKKVKVADSNYPFSHTFKRDENQSNSASVFKFTVPGTGENKTPTNNSPDSDSAFKELISILKERGLISENTELKNVEDVLNALKTKKQNQAQQISNQVKAKSQDTVCQNVQAKKQNQAQQISNQVKAKSQDTVCRQNVQASQKGGLNNAEKNKQLGTQNQKKKKKQNIPRAIQQRPMQRPIPSVMDLQYQQRNLHNRPMYPPTPMMPNMLMQQGLYRYPFSNFQAYPQQYQHFNSIPQTGRRQWNSCTLTFQNLPPTVTEQVLTYKMLEVGNLDFCRITGFGQAVVRFKTTQDADRCQKIFHKSIVDKHIVNVSYKY